MEGKRSEKILQASQSTEWRVNNVGFVSLAFGGFLLLGCISAYLLAVARGNVEAFLPLISDAAGSPPQNGLFGGFISIGGMFGVAFMIVRYMIVSEKNGDKSSVVSILNKLSLSCGIVSMLALLLVTGYPINFYRNRDIWFLAVGFPHLIGGVTLLSLGLVYIGLQCVLTLILKSKNKMILLVRLFLLFVCSASFLYHMVNVPDHFKGISDKYYFNNTERNPMNTDLLPFPPTLGASLKLPIDTSNNYVTTSLTQWIFLFSFCCFFFTYYKEIQQYSLHLVIEIHSTKEPVVIEDRKAEIRRLSLAIQKTGLVNTTTAPEVRKYFRRDSTCQTMMDTSDDVPNASKKDEKSLKCSKKDLGENGASKIS